MLTDVTVGAGMVYGTDGVFIDETVDSYTQQVGGVLQVEIGSAGFDQIEVMNQAALSGTLQVKLVDGFEPAEGDTFDFLTFGAVTGTFDIGTGLYGFSDSNLYFEVVQQSDRLQLVAHELTLLNDVGLQASSVMSADSFGQFFNTHYFGFDTFTASGTLTVDDFFSVSGSFALQSSVQTVTLADGTSVETTAFQIGGHNLSAFAGNNGPYLRDSNGDGVIDGDDTPNPVAVGLSLGNVDFGLGLFSVAGVNFEDSTIWTTLTASAGTVDVVGMPDVTASSSDLKVEVNAAFNVDPDFDPDDRVIDFSGAPLAIVTGATTSVVVDTDGAEGQFVRAAGNVELSVGDFFGASGGFAFEQYRAEVALGNGDLIDVDLLTLGANNTSAFAGVHPGTADEIGLSLTGADFALAVASERLDVSDAPRVWTSLASSGGAASLSGVPNVTATGSNVAVELNLAAVDGSLIDFLAQPLDVPTGPTTTHTFAMDASLGELVRALGTLDVGVGDFVTVFR
jgi:hypothetical protein